MPNVLRHTMFVLNNDVHEKRADSRMCWTLLKNELQPASALAVAVVLRPDPAKPPADEISNPFPAETCAC